PKRGYRISPAALAHKINHPFKKSRENSNFDDQAALSFSPIESTADSSSMNEARSYIRRSFVKIAIAGICIVAVLGLVALSSKSPRLLSVRQITFDGLQKSAGAPLLSRDGKLWFGERSDRGNILAAVSTDGGVITTRGLPDEAGQASSINPANGDLLISR